MKILYDHQIFELQKFGGISRIYFELIQQFSNDKTVEWELPIQYSDSLHLRGMPYFNNTLKPLPKQVDYLKQFLFGVDFRGKRLVYEIKKRIFPQPTSLDVSAINKSLVIQKLKEGNFDIFHPTYYDDYFLEFLNHKPFVLTVYDLIHQIFPEYFLYNELDKSALLLNRASMILTISHSTKKDLIDIFGVDENKIRVTHLGNSLQLNDTKVIKPHLESNLLNGYFLVVGNRAEYKNFLFFIRMFASLTNRYKNISVICTGPVFSKDELYYFKKLQLESKVKHVMAGDSQLITLYQEAIALVIPSQYEGFGLPLLEAFSCGCLVLAGENSSLVEIAEDAAIFFDDKKPATLIQAMEIALNDSKLRGEKIEKGYAQVLKFSWQHTAQQTVMAYQEVLTGTQS